jgi:hypothetical protein
MRGSNSRRPDERFPRVTAGPVQDATRRRCVWLDVEHFAGHVRSKKGSSVFEKGCPEPSPVVSREGIGRWEAVMDRSTTQTLIRAPTPPPGAVQEPCFGSAMRRCG